MAEGERSGPRLAVGRTEDGTLFLAAPLTMPAGSYQATIVVEGENGEAREVLVGVIVDPLLRVPLGFSQPPVILLNGWQYSFFNSCPISRPEETFGPWYASFLRNVPRVYWFDNCTQCWNCSIEKLGDSLAEVMKLIQYSSGEQVLNFDLVGHSMGGAASIRYASTHPERVAGLVLVSTPGKTPSEMVTAVMGAMKADYVKATQGYWDKLLKNAQPEVNSLIREGISRVPQAASVAMIESIFAYDPFSDLAAYKGPKLIVDTDAPDAAGALHMQAQSVSRKVIAQTSHWPQMDRPEVFNGILDVFLAAAR